MNISIGFVIIKKLKNVICIDGRKVYRLLMVGLMLFKDLKTYTNEKYCKRFVLLQGRPFFIFFMLQTLFIHVFDEYFSLV